MSSTYLDQTTKLFLITDLVSVVSAYSCPKADHLLTEILECFLQSDNWGRYYCSSMSGSPGHKQINYLHTLTFYGRILFGLEESCVGVGNSTTESLENFKRQMMYRLARLPIHDLENIERIIKKL